MRKLVAGLLALILALSPLTELGCEAKQTTDWTMKSETSWTEENGVRTEQEHRVWTYSDGHQNYQDITRVLKNGKVVSEEEGTIYVLKGPDGDKLFADLTSAHPDYYAYDWLNSQRIFEREVQGKKYRAYPYAETTRGYFLQRLFDTYYDVISDDGHHAGDPSKAKDIKKSEAYYWGMRWAVKLGLVEVKGGKVGRDELTTPKWEGQVLTKLGKLLGAGKITWHGLDDKETIRCHSIDRIYQFAQIKKCEPHRSR